MIRFCYRMMELALASSCISDESLTEEKPLTVEEEEEKFIRTQPVIIKAKSAGALVSILDTIDMIPNVKVRENNYCLMFVIK